MFDQWNKPPTMDEILQGLRIALPGGDVVPTRITSAEEGFLTKEFHFHLHRFLFRGETVILKSAAYPVYTVFWSTIPTHPIFNGKPIAFHDTCEMLSAEDLLGWTSFVRGEIERLALMPFVRNLDPRNLFSDGLASVSEYLTVPRQTLVSCGVTELAPLIKVHLTFPWAVSVKDGATRFHLPIHGCSHDGWFAAKLQTDGPASGTMKYKYEIPIPFDLKLLRKNPDNAEAQGKLLGNGETQIKVPHSTMRYSQVLLVGFFQDLLTDVYLSRVLEYAEKKQAMGS